MTARVVGEGREPLFEVDLDEAAEEIAEPEKVTERHMLDLLAKRYTRVSMNAHRYAFAEHVPSSPDPRAGYQRIADFIAVDCYGGGRWPKEYEIHGHEVKISRSDWLTELKDPDKAEAFRPFVHRWWLVVPDASIVKGDLPEGWGLMAGRTVLRAIVSAPRLIPDPMPPPLVASWLRATAKTTRRSA